MITPRDFTAWLELPVTKEFLTVMEEDMFKLAHGNMTDSMCLDQIKNAISVGNYQAIKKYYTLLKQAGFYELFGGTPDGQDKEQDGTKTS